MREATKRWRYGQAPPALALAGLLLAGCAGTMREAPPAVNYVPDASYHLLMAEIAVQRGVFRTAAQEYLTAAQQSRDSSIARRATEFSFDYGLDSFARLAAQRWAVLEPDSTAAHEYLGRLALRRHDDERTYRHYAEIIGAAAGRSGEDYLLLDADLADEANTGGVLKLLLRLGAEGPDSPGYELAVARAALRARAYPLAVHAAGRAAAAGLGPEADLLLGRALFLAGDTQPALARLALAVRTWPSLGVQLEFLRLLASAGEIELATRGLDSLLASHGRRPEILGLRGLLRLETGDLAGAAEDFSENAAGGYEVYEAFFHLGDIAAAQAQPTRALRYYQRIGAGEYLLPAQFRIAGLRATAGDVPGALAHLDQFAASNPRYAFAMLVGRARLLQGLGRDEEALASLNDALGFRPDDVSLLITRGTVLDRLGRVDAALDDMRRAARLAPDDADALNTLGYTLANRSSRFEEAAGLVRLALQLDAGNPAILDSMGWVLFRRGEPEAARGYLELAHSALPDPEIAAHLGEVLWATGEPGAAREIWAAALAEFPDSLPLRETMDRLDR